MGTPKMANRRASKRILKPVIEKKRRDRINQRLDELRTLLLDNTLDSRLQNPKLEKAEILELTVDYIRKRSNSNKDSLDVVAPLPTSRKPRLPCISIHDPTSLQNNSSLYTAGFQDCISRLTGFIDCVEPSQRENFVQGLRHHLDSHSLRVPSNPWACGTPEPFSYTGNHQLYPNSFVLHHPHPYPSPPYSLSPPPSPCYSTTSPTYLTIPCHFPFPPSVSPLSSDSCSSTSCPPQRTLRRALFQNQQQNMWRPW
uniref:Transcription factor HES-7-like n=1 Tax=Astyanax mexicanus TaxID=7994 RepID=A0A8B9JWJ5_ASTMX